MALEYESNPNLVGAIKAPLGVLGADKNYRQVLYETIAEQVEGLGRRPNANYNVGEVVYPSSNLKYALTCTTAGTSDATDLNISTNTEGDTITDGTVTWKVVKRNYLGSDGALPIANGGTGATTAANARTNLGLNKAVTGASISGKTITLTFADGTTKTLTTQDTDTNNISAQSLGTNGYIKFNNGLIIQWGKVTNAGSGVTFPVAFASNVYTIVTSYQDSGSTSSAYYGLWCVSSYTLNGFNMADRNGNKINYVAFGK